MHNIYSTLGKHIATLLPSDLSRAKALLFNLGMGDIWEDQVKSGLTLDLTHLSFASDSDLQGFCELMERNI